MVVTNATFAARSLGLATRRSWAATSFTSKIVWNARGTGRSSGLGSGIESGCVQNVVAPGRLCCRHAMRMLQCDQHVVHDPDSQRA